MSIVLTRSPLEPIGMNGGAVPKRRSARLSQEANGENEPPAKKTKVNGASSTATVSTKQQDGDSNKTTAKRKRKVYDVEVDDFTFSRGRRSKGKETKTIEEPVTRPAVANTEAVQSAPAAPSSDVPVPAAPPASAAEEVAPRTTKKTRRRLPTTPEKDVVEKTVRRSKRLSNDKGPEPAPEPSPQRPSHAKSHANTDRERSPSPEKARPVTIEKKRKQGTNGVEEQKIMTISLPFADTPIIRRNKEMRKNSADGHRRSSAGMRGKRASSLIDEGRGHEASTYKAVDEDVRNTISAPAQGSADLLLVFDAFLRKGETFADDDSPHTALPHAEVPTSEFFKHISADLPEPRRMRCLLGWCGTRSLPSKSNPPSVNSPADNLELQAVQAARVIQEELSQELVIRGSLSDWFSRDDSEQPPIPLKKKANPRNVANGAKAEELEKQLERLKKERAEWDDLIFSSAPPPTTDSENVPAPGELSPIRPDTLDSPQRAMFQQLQSSTGDEAWTDPAEIQKRLQTISDELEFAVDQFAHGVHTLTTTKETADRVAERSLADAARALDEREKQRAASDKPVGQMDALRGLARILNRQNKR